MAVLPADRRLSLDTLVKRHAPRPSRAEPPTPSIPRAPSPTASSVPTALALWITVRRCATCGSVTRCPPDAFLVRYEAHAHSIHYAHADLTPSLAALPRELREKHATIPMCEDCFSPKPQSATLCGEAAPPTERASED